MVLVPEEAWYPAIEDDGEVREKAFAAELTNLVGMSAWPEGSRVALRRERPHPGAQLILFEAQDGWRYTAFITGTRPGKLSVERLELRHRKHARVEDRIRQSKATGLNNFPCEAMAENRAWTRVAMAAADLVYWSKLVCFADEPTIARCEIEAFRYAILHMAGKLTPLGPPGLPASLPDLGLGQGPGEGVLPSPGRFCHLSRLPGALGTTTNGHGPLLHAQEQPHLPCRQPGGARGRAAPGRQRSFRPRMAPTPVRIGNFQPSNSRWRSYVKDRG